MSWRDARVHAEDIHELDRVKKNSTWLVVTAKPIEENGKVLITLEGQAEQEEYNRKDPVDVQWWVPSTTYGMRKDVRR